MINEDLKQHIITSLRENTRIDGRRREDFREIVVEYGISGSAEGSARVRIGGTEVLAGVKISVEKPYPDTPDQGNLMVNAELLPLSNPNFEPGPPGIDSIELARVVDRGIRESKAIDSKKLCIESGEKVWMVSIDICSINDEGNLFDASALATIAAIQDAVFPEYDGTSVDYKHLSDKKLPLDKIPISITVLKVGDQIIVDPTKEEEESISARLTVASTENGELCAMQKGGDMPLTTEEIQTMVELALDKAKELRSKLK